VRWASSALQGTVSLYIPVAIINWWNTHPRIAHGRVTRRVVNVSNGVYNFRGNLDRVVHVLSILSSTPLDGHIRAHQEMVACHRVHLISRRVKQDTRNAAAALAPQKNRRDRKLVPTKKEEKKKDRQTCTKKKQGKGAVRVEG